mgnify:CR=1 FL=1
MLFDLPVEEVREICGTVHEVNDTLSSGKKQA